MKKSIFILSLFISLVFILHTTPAFADKLDTDNFIGITGNTVPQYNSHYYLASGYYSDHNANLIIAPGGGLRNSPSSSLNNVGGFNTDMTQFGSPKYYCESINFTRDAADKEVFPELGLHNQNRTYGPITGGTGLTSEFDFHFDTSSIMLEIYDFQTGTILVSNQSFPFDNTFNNHSIQFCDINGIASNYVDGAKKQSVSYNGALGGDPTINFAYAPNSTITQFEIDNPNSSSDLNIPLLKQTSSPWGSQLYDSANLWDPARLTIGNWGCAITSATMILQYYGITKLPDGTLLDPGTLNTWLKNQQDGYVNEGWVNWLAIERLSKLAKNQNPGFTYDALEYKRKGFADRTQLTNDLNNSQPDILEEPGHFIVAKGINGNTFNINDPYYNRSDLTQGYNNSFLTLGRYVPSHTDLSYIMLTVNPNINVTVQTASTSAIGDSFIQQPYEDPLSPGTFNGQPLKIVYVPQPTTGDYKVSLFGSTNQPYQLDTYLYDKDGNVNMISKPGTVSKDKQDIFTISFNQQNATASGAKRIITFQNMVDDIHENNSLKMINNDIANALLAVAETAKDSYDKGKKPAAKLKLDILEGVLYLFRNRGISETAFQILLYDSNSLKNSL